MDHEKNLLAAGNVCSFSLCGSFPAEVPVQPAGRNPGLQTEPGANACRYGSVLVLVPGLNPADPHREAPCVLLHVCGSRKAAGNPTQIRSLEKNLHFSEPGSVTRWFLNPNGSEGRTGSSVWLCCPGASDRWLPSGSTALSFYMRMETKETSYDQSD